MDYRDIEEIRRMIAVGNKFKYALIKEKKNKFYVAFELNEENIFFVSKQKRKTNQLTPKTHSKADTAIQTIKKTGFTGEIKVQIEYE